MFKIQKLQLIYRVPDVQKFNFKCSKAGKLTVVSEKLTAACEKLDNGELIPLARSGHKAFFYLGAFYIFGGYRSDLPNTLVDIWRYYPLMHVWESVTPGTQIPAENLSSASTQFGDKMYLFGGSGADFGESNSNKLYLIDLKTLSFSPIELASEGDFCPTPGYGHSLTYCQEKQCLYLCCGIDGHSYEVKVFKFNLRERRWIVMPPDKQCVTPRYRQESFVWEQGWYLLGGSIDRRCHDMTCMHKFCFNSEKWEMMPLLPDPAHGYPSQRRGFASVRYRDRLYIFGGSGFSSNNYLCHLVEDSGLWHIDLPTMRWSLIQGCKPPRPVDFFAVALDDSGKVIIHGGRKDLTYNKRTPESYILWLDVPPLVDLCWENIRIWEKEGFLSLPLSQLMALGLPRSVAMQVTQFVQSCSF